MVEALRSVWHERPATARRVRQRISTVMEWAVALNYRDDNPCSRIGPVLGPQQDLVQHTRALPHRDVAALVATVRASGAALGVKLAFEFLVLTAARSGEVRGARWAEIDTDDHVWTIPVTRTKAKREHRVPLCGRALEILDAARSLDDGNALVFPSVRGKRMNDMALSALLRTLTRRHVERMVGGLARTQRNRVLAFTSRVFRQFEQWEWREQNTNPALYAAVVEGYVEWRTALVEAVVRAELSGAVTLHPDGHELCVRRLANLLQMASSYREGREWSCECTTAASWPAFATILPITGPEVMRPSRYIGKPVERGRDRGSAGQRRRRRRPVQLRAARRHRARQQAAQGAA